MNVRPLWLGQGLLPIMPTLSPANQGGQLPTGRLPRPNAPPPEGYAGYDGTWLYQSSNLVGSHNSSGGRDCDYQDTYENWQKGGIWNPCDPSQPAGQVKKIVRPPQATDPVPVPAPPAPSAVQTPAAPPAAAPAPIQTQAKSITPLPPPTTVPPAGSDAGSKETAQGGGIPVQNPWQPGQGFTQPIQVPIVPAPGAAPAPKAEAKDPEAPAENTSGKTTALVAGGIGAVGVIAALVIGVFRK